MFSKFIQFIRTAVWNVTFWRKWFCTFDEIEIVAHLEIFRFFVFFFRSLNILIFFWFVVSDLRFSKNSGSVVLTFISGQRSKIIRFYYLQYFFDLILIQSKCSLKSNEWFWGCHFIKMLFFITSKIENVLWYFWLQTKKERRNSKVVIFYPPFALSQTVPLALLKKTSM